jgi:hypothetical protein
MSDYPKFRRIFWMKIPLLLGVIFFVLWAIPVFSQIDTPWVKSYKGLGNSADVSRDAVTNDYSNLYMTGQSFGSGSSNDYKNIDSWQSACTPGDFNNNGTVNLEDVAFIINYLFLCGSAPPCQPVEANGNCELDCGDAEYLINYLFVPGSPAPVAWCSDSDTYSDPGYPDTIRIGTICDSVGTTVDVPVYIYNDEAIQPVIPLKIDTTYVVCDSVITAGTRGAGKVKGIKKYCRDYRGILLYPDGVNFLEAGSGVVAYLRCRIKEGMPSGFVKIDSTFLDPNKLRFFKENTFSIKPIFISGGINIKTSCVDTLDCNKSSADPCIKICPSGEIPFNVYLKDNSDNPVVGYSNVWLDFSGCSGITRCTTQTQWPIVYPQAPSDGSGKVTFYISAGGCDQGCLIPVKANCGTIANVPVRSLDNSGNLFVSYSDFDSSYGLCRDYNCDDTVDYKDLAFFNEHKRHSCTTGPPNPCQYFRNYLVIDPDTNLSPGKTTKVTLFVQNNSTTDCSIDSIKFYYSGFGALDTLKQFSSLIVGFNLSPGDSLSLGADYLWHDTSAAVFYARIYTDCCSSYIQVERNINRVRQCPPSAMDFKFGWKVGFSPVYTDTLSFMPPGWSYSINYPVLPDSGVIIRTSNLSPLGTKGSLSLAAYTDPGRTNFVAERTFEVFVTMRSGDANGDCKVTVSDVVYIINYLFKGGPAPKPLKVADTNCDGKVTVSDVVYLINYLFKGGPPSPCSE